MSFKQMIVSLTGCLLVSSVADTWIESIKIIVGVALVLYAGLKMDEE